MGVATLGHMGNNSVLGGFGEQLAIDYLRAHGMRILCRNWRCRLGEIDVVAADGEVTVFVEVKTRRSIRYGPPVEAVTEAKQQRLRRLAALWLACRGGRWGNIRFDVVSILLADKQHPVLTHHRGVF